MTLCKKFIILILILLFLILFLWADETAQVSSNTTSSVPEKLQSVRNEILQFLEDLKVPSLAVAVAKDGKIIWEEGFGWANREKQIKATPHTVYPLASISKPITATGLMILADRELIYLNKPVNDYLDKEKLKAYAGKASDATLKRILLHTAGLPMYLNMFYKNELDLRPSMEESIKRYGIIVTPPGEAFNYSNFGYGIVDHIISIVSGTSYEDFMREEVFEPLGMIRTSFQIDPDLDDYVALKYDEKQNPIDFSDYDHRGASAVYSSAHDLVRFGMFHLKNHLEDQKPILKDESIDAMQMEKDPKIPDSEYALGWSSVDFSGYRFVNHNGGIPGVSTRLTLLPSKNMAAVLLCNGSTELWKIESAIWAALIPEYAEKIKNREITVEEKPKKPSFPESLKGEWTGKIKTYDDDLSAKITFNENGGYVFQLKGKTCSRINMKTPLGEMGFKDGIFRGLFFGNIGTADTARSFHAIFVQLKLRGNILNGYAAAVAAGQQFILPYWIELTKVPKIQGN